MPIIKSAKKRVRVARKAAVRNAKTKRLVKSTLKAFQAKTTPMSLAQAQSAIDKAAKKDVLHKNKAARKKRQLAAAAKAAGVKLGAKSAGRRPTVKKTPVKKAAPEKSTAKKSPIKKSAKKK